jgi:IclR family acetate operon transcriptional repressor
MIHVGLKALAGVNIRAIAVPVLKDLAEQTSETAHLAVLSDDRSLILEVCDSPHPLRIASRPGSLAWLHASATGKVFQAYLLGDRIEELYQEAPPKLTPRTITTADEARAETKRTLARGFGLDDEEYYEGARCLAAPVLNARQEVVAAIGITGATTRFTLEHVDEFASYVKAAARKISEQLGS